MQKNDEYRSISSSMVVIMIFMTLSKAMGFLREMVISAKFGMNWITDAYNAAYDIPCLLLTVVAMAISSVFIPVYNSRLQAGEAASQRFVSNLYSVGLAISTVIALATLACLPFLVKIMLPEADEATQALTLRLAQVMMPMAVFAFLHRLTTAYLHARFEFAVPAIATLFYNLCIVAGILVSGGNIYLVAVATLLGTLLQFLAQLPKARKMGLAWKPSFSLKEPGTLTVFQLMLPVLVAGAFDQLYIVFDRMVTSGVGGDISALSYGNRISTMVSAVLLSSIATVLYPNLVRDAKTPKRYIEHFALGINLNLLIALPAMAALLMLRIPITRLAYERGEFLSEHTLITAGTLGCYTLGLLGMGIRELSSRGFYALQDMKTPTLVGIGVALLNITLNYALYPLFGVSGVALAMATSASLGATAQYILLRKQVGHLDGRRILTCLAKTLTATAAMCAFLTLGIQRTALTTAQGRDLFLYLGILGVGGILTYFAVLWALKTKELRMLLGMLRRRAGKGTGREA